MEYAEHGLGVLGLQLLRDGRDALGPGPPVLKLRAWARVRALAGALLSLEALLEVGLDLPAPRVQQRLKVLHNLRVLLHDVMRSRGARVDLILRVDALQLDAATQGADRLAQLAAELVEPVQELLLLIHVTEPPIRAATLQERQEHAAERRVERFKRIP